MENIRNISSKTEKKTRLAFDKYRGVFWGVVRWIPSHFPVQRNFVWAGSGVIASELFGATGATTIFPLVVFSPKMIRSTQFISDRISERKVKHGSDVSQLPGYSKNNFSRSNISSSRWWTALVEGQLFNFSCWASGEKIAWRFLVKKYPMIKLPIWGDQSCKCMVNLRDFPFTVHCFGLVSYNDHSPWFPEFCWLEFSFGVEDWHK